MVFDVNKDRTFQTVQFKYDIHNAIMYSQIRKSAACQLDSVVLSSKQRMRNYFFVEPEQIEALEIYNKNFLNSRRLLSPRKTYTDVAQLFVCVVVCTTIRSPYPQRTCLLCVFDIKKKCFSRLQINVFKISQSHTVGSVNWRSNRSATRRVIMPYLIYVTRLHVDF